MTIEEAKEKCEQLGDDLFDLVKKFNDETGLVVVDLDLPVSFERPMGRKTFAVYTEGLRVSIMVIP